MEPTTPANVDATVSAPLTTSMEPTSTPVNIDGRVLRSYLQEAKGNARAHANRTTN